MEPEPMETPDEMPVAIMDTADDEDAIPECPASPLYSNNNNYDDDDVIYVSSRGPISDIPFFYDSNSCQNFCYGQNFDDF